MFSPIWESVTSVARIAPLLNQNLKKMQPAIFLLIKSKELDATDTLQMELIPRSVLKPVNFKDSLTLDTDSFNVRIGSAFLQQQLDETVNQTES